MHAIVACRGFQESKVQKYSSDDDGWMNSRMDGWVDISDGRRSKGASFFFPNHRIISKYLSWELCSTSQKKLSLYF